MKHIRTETFIIELEDWMEVDEETLKIGSVKYKIIAQADTIEELCDEFVVNADFYNKPNILTKVNSLPIDIDLTTHIIYGAIWTKWGLKYVAKLNKEGELELL